MADESITVRHRETGEEHTFNPREFRTFMADPDQTGLWEVTATTVSDTAGLNLELAHEQFTKERQAWNRERRRHELLLEGLIHALIGSEEVALGDKKGTAAYDVLSTAIDMAPFAKSFPDAIKMVLTIKGVKWERTYDDDLDDDC